MNSLFKVLLGCKSSTLSLKCLSQAAVGFRRFQSSQPRPATVADILVTRGNENSFSFGIVKSCIENDIFQTSKDAISSKFDIDPAALDSKQLDELVQNVMAQIGKLTDLELVGLLDVLDKLKNTEHFLPLWKAIDKEGTLRTSSAEPAVTLAATMKMFDMRLNVIKSEWAWATLRRLCRKLSRHKPSEVVQIMFLANLCRRFPALNNSFDIQFELVRHFDDFTLDQMAVIAVTFFKCETKMNNKVIMSKILRKLMEEAESSNSYSLAMLSKIIRYSLPVTLSDELLVLQDRLTAVIPKMDLTCLTHVALAGTNVLVCHEPLIRAIIERMRNSMSELRIKDLERIALVMSMYNLHDQDFVERLVKDLPGREDEIALFPKAYVCLVNYLVLMQHFDFNLINRVLSTKFIKETYGLSYRKIGGELIFIDKTTEIERPDYSGNKLDSATLKNSARIMSFSQQSTLTGTQKFSYELEENLMKLYKQENVLYTTVLPQYCFADFIIGFNERKEPQAAPAEWRVHRWGEVKKRPDDVNDWLAVVVGGWNTVIRNKGEPLGMLRAKIRHLKMLGYRPVVVHYNDWRQAKDKLGFLKSLIDEEMAKIDK